MPRNEKRENYIARGNQVFYWAENIGDYDLFLTINDKQKDATAPVEAQAIAMAGIFNRNMGR